MKTLLEVAFLCALFSSLGCDTFQVCNESYSTVSDREACYVGADQIAPKVVQELGRVPGEPEATHSCDRDCTARFALGTPVTHDSVDFARLVEKNADRASACSAACRAKLEYWHGMNDPTAAEPILSQPKPPQH